MPSLRCTPGGVDGRARHIPGAIAQPPAPPENRAHALLTRRPHRLAPQARPPHRAGIRPRRRRPRRAGRRSAEGLGRLRPRNSQSQLATDQIEHATGLEPTAGIVLLVATPQGAHAAAPRIAAIRHRLAGVPGIARTLAPAATARDGRHVLVTGTLTASADDKQTAKRAESAFAHDHDVTVGGPAVANEQINASVTSDLAQGGAAGLPAADPPLAAVLPRPGGADAAGRRDRHRARHVPRPHRRQPASTG